MRTPLILVLSIIYAIVMLVWSMLSGEIGKLYGLYILFYGPGITYSILLLFTCWPGILRAFFYVASSGFLYFIVTCIAVQAEDGNDIPSLYLLAGALGGTGFYLFTKFLVNNKLPGSGAAAAFAAGGLSFLPDYLSASGDQFGYSIFIWILSYSVVLTAASSMQVKASSNKTSEEK